MDVKPPPIQGVLVVTAAGAAVLAAGFGAAIGAAGIASVEVCWDLAYDGTTDYYYC